MEALAVVMAKHLSLNRLRSAFRMVSEEEGEEPSDSVTPEELFVDKETGEETTPEERETTFNDMVRIATTDRKSVV